MNCTIYDFKFYDRTKSVSEIVEIKNYFGKKNNYNKYYLVNSPS